MKGPGFAAPLDDAMPVDDEALALLDSSKIGICQAECSDAGEVERLNVRGASTDAVVLHENDPVTYAGQR